MEQQHSGDDTYPSGFGPSRFGRGWIPAERDIGLPGEDHRSLNSVQPELVEGLLYSSTEAPGHEEQNGPSTSSGQTDADLAQVGSIRHDAFTPQRKARFLHHLSEQGNVRLACAAVGVSAQAAYVARRRERAFAAAWAAALVLARGAVEQVLADRALHGVAEPIFYRGEQVGARLRFDSRLLLAHLARLDKVADEISSCELADRFDELLALVAGEAPPAGMTEPGEVLPRPRAAYVAAAADRAERELHWQMDEEEEDENNGGFVFDSDSDDDGEDDDDETLLSYEERHDRAIGAARVEAAARWDAWLARAYAVGDGLLANDASPPGTPSSTPAVAPAQAGAHPKRAPERWTRLRDESSDGPLPAQGRREEGGEAQELPAEFKSLHPVNCVNFGAGLGPRVRLC